MALSAFTNQSACALLLSIAAAAAGAQQATEPATGPTPARLRSNDALLTLDYQAIKVPGDRALDLLGIHAYTRVLDGLYLGGGFYAPALKGDYGGFVAADVGLHVRRRLSASLLATAGLSFGAGGGGRSVEHSKLLSGTGGLLRAHAGLAYDFGEFTLGAGLSRMKFRKSLIDGTQLNAYVEIPFRYLTGRHADHGHTLSAADEGLARSQMGETLLSFSFDNYKQIDPQGTSQRNIGLADLQFAHFLGADTYWFASLGMGYRGLPLYNQLLGGLGRRWRLDGGLTLYGQLGLGSGGYAPTVMATGSGLLLYPRLMAEYRLSRDLGLAATLGYMAAPDGSSRNASYGLALIRHLGSGSGSGSGGATAGAGRYQGLRLSVFHQSADQLRYRGIERPGLKMVSLQLDLPLSPHLYLPLQASGAYNAYLGYPGYAEILAGLGLQTRTGPGERLQAFGQLLGGANVHGRTLKAGVGLRYLLDERLALQVSLGQTRATSAGGGRFSANNLGLGMDYRFSVPSL
ncbi:hypothetical protein J7U46_02975 [Pelomonas sp. V22]|uniref:hypothetical protein n=1 Tax=Pelomonas sp. V22 TaxID=2822139 RepID=UPI0024A9FF07|nr:hypothetical protein [Pelomonas sp. V22]MDI4632004.1 hypothetical protein [Pelomonas sp. V22]